jgi:FtsP/CotA-like multicopper oxidase with cupredoxin domain
VKFRAAVLLALLLAALEAHDARPAPRETFRDPAAVASRDGVLALTLTAARATVDVVHRPVLAAAYNGAYIPPTLRVRPGDVVRLRLVNDLDEATNLHTHGLSVSPLGNSDNAFLHIAPGRALDYELRIPATHAPGLYWYHPHPHGRSDEQVRNAMSGALIVEGLLDPFPELRHVTEHVLLLKDAQIIAGSATTRYAR